MITMRATTSASSDELDDKEGETHLSLRAMLRSVDVVDVSGREIALRVKVDHKE